MYHFVYMTASESGLFYIGRHSTDNIFDGYMGSGVWVNRCDKSKLQRRILSFANDYEHLLQLADGTHNFLKKKAH